MDYKVYFEYGLLFISIALIFIGLWAVSKNLDKQERQAKKKAMTETFKMKVKRKDNV